MSITHSDWSRSIGRHRSASTLRLAQAAAPIVRKALVLSGVLGVFVLAFGCILALRFWRYGGHEAATALLHWLTSLLP